MKNLIIVTLVLFSGAL